MTPDHGANPTDEHRQQQAPPSQPPQGQPQFQQPSNQPPQGQPQFQQPPTQPPQGQQGPPQQQSQQPQQGMPPQMGQQGPPQQQHVQQMPAQQLQQGPPQQQQHPPQGATSQAPQQQGMGQQRQPQSQQQPMGQQRQPGLQPQQQAGQAQPFLKPARVNQVITENVVTAERDTPIQTIVAQMAENDVGSVIVVEDERPIGIITDRKVAIALEEMPDIANQAAEELIGGELVTADPSMSIFDALDLMRSESIRRLPIVDDNGTLRGIVTLDDILVMLGGVFGGIAETIESQSPRF